MKQLSIGLALAGLVLLAWLAYRAATPTSGLTSVTGGEQQTSEFASDDLPAESAFTNGLSKAPGAGGARRSSAGSNLSGARTGTFAAGGVMGPQDVSPPAGSSEVRVLVPAGNEELSPEEEAQRIAARQLHYEENQEKRDFENPDSAPPTRQTPAAPTERKPDSEAF